MVRQGRAVVPLYLFFAVTLGACYGLLVSLRYNVPWSEGDTSYFARTIASLIQAGTFSEALNHHTYPQGFVYQAWASALTLLSGTSVDGYITLTSPVLGCAFLALFGFATFRKLLASDQAGLLATFVLFLVPEITFVVSRGNHEKLTLSFTLLAALLLFEALNALYLGRGARTVGAWAVAYLLVVFSAVSTNLYFGSVIVVAVTILLVVTFLLLRFYPRFGASLPRIATYLALTAVVSWLMVGLVLFVVYPPSNAFLGVVETAFERVAALFGTRTAQSNPYLRIAQVWVSQRAYFYVSLFRWVFFLGSFLAWLGMLVSTLYKAPGISLTRFFTLGLYGAFGAVLALAVPVDFAGLDVGSNLQVRVYIYFAAFSAPLFTLGAIKLVTLARRGFVRGLVISAVSVSFTLFAFSGFLKLTQDPAVSYVWRFYEPQEVSAVRFYLNHQPDRTRYLWIGPDARLRHGYYTTYPEEAVELLFNPVTNLQNAAALHLTAGFALPTTDYALDSAIVRANTNAWQVWPFPKAINGGQIYDNGAASIHYLPPETPYAN